MTEVTIWVLGLFSLFAMTLGALVWFSRHLGKMQERTRTYEKQIRGYSQRSRARQEVDMALRDNHERERLRRKFSRS